MWYPTVLPNLYFISSLTLAAKLVAARRRGSQMAILELGFAFKINWGTCVDFPHPVLPLMIDTLSLLIKATIYF